MIYDFNLKKIYFSEEAMVRTRTEAAGLSRPPKGYDENNPAIEFIKLKSFIATAPLTDAQITDKSFTSTVVKAFEALQPLIIFLNRAVEG